MRTPEKQVETIRLGGSGIGGIQILRDTRLSRLGLPTPPTYALVVRNSEEELEEALKVGRRALRELAPHIEETFMRLPTSMLEGFRFL